MLPPTAHPAPRTVLAVLALLACEAGPEVVPGVSQSLAEARAAQIARVHYEIAFTVPASLEEAVEGEVTIEVTLREGGRAVVLDFNAPDGAVHQVSVGGAPVAAEVRDGHIVVPGRPLRPGPNTIDVRFRAGNGALNRNEEFLYTLFVPDRASTAFPCFDQPDVKGSYQLTLRLPPGWVGVSNTAVGSADTTDAGTTVRFLRSAPLSTYLFAFAAGRFQVETAERDGRVMRFYHRETDSERVRRNRDAIFDLHAAALSWLASYTGIPYPFDNGDVDKFDFVAIPSFQYGGMEHAGAILYRAASLFLEESPTQAQLLGRASLIAHETAHMWFGDLVTMRWFDDVWMKEVFANFMAAKIVNPSFPDVDHELRFLLAHYPAAYGVDRTQGANPVRQQLDNLLEAGTLYGAIIYQKAPIVMRQLERLLGEEDLRAGLHEYLRTNEYGNASWPDLIAVLDARTPMDLQEWSRLWVEEPGRPTITATAEPAPDGTLRTLALRQQDPFERGLAWDQRTEVVLGPADALLRLPVHLDGETVEVGAAAGLATPPWILPGGATGYGHVVLDPASREALFRDAPLIAEPVVRAAAWMALWEAVLDGDLDPEAFLRRVLAALPGETDQQIVQQLLGMARTAYWRFLDADARAAVAPAVEETLWSEILRRRESGFKAAYFGAYIDVALTAEGVARLERLWRGDEEVPGLPLTEQRTTSLAEELALREVPHAEAILDGQLERISNPDRRARFAFVRPALSSDSAVRDSVFESLRHTHNREREPWALSAVSFLHHPLRAERSERYLAPSLQLLEEIQRTGDIFFPLRWLNATLDGHQSVAAAEAVLRFLRSHPDLPPRLAGKVLQAADPLFRAAQIVSGWEGGETAADLGRTLVRGTR